eukprot:c10511_g1_i1.p1 GENE.c10511_g1_i1~~c10511_g1_i1.p1  ORF type:complete len:243 (+),score=74.38 c10511_g1_i1:39-767(+)
MKHPTRTPLVRAPQGPKHVNPESLQAALNIPAPIPPETLPFHHQPGVAIVPAQTQIDWFFNHNATNITILSRARSFTGQTPAELLYELAERTFLELAGYDLGLKVRGVVAVNNQWDVDRFEENRLRFEKQGKGAEFIWCAVNVEENSMKLQELVDLGYRVNSFGLGPSQSGDLMLKCAATDVPREGMVALVKVLPGKISRIPNKTAMHGYDSFQNENRLSVFSPSQVLLVFLVKFDGIRRPQ